MQSHLLAREKFISKARSTSGAVVPRSPSICRLVLVVAYQRGYSTSRVPLTTGDLEQWFLEQFGHTLCKNEAVSIIIQEG
jgi:hypothetical protein